MAEGDNQGFQNNCEPLHSAKRSCSPALAEEQEGPASPPACSGGADLPLCCSKGGISQDERQLLQGKDLLRLSEREEWEPAQLLQWPPKPHSLKSSCAFKQFLRPSRGGQWCICCFLPPTPGCFLCEGKGLTWKCVEAFYDFL